ncbi:MAG: hypothetical protein IT385_18445 [Deltaproteobacteria bacterium]|nr:hypothetical protein [Deltaproteobacteria bacterium]
MRIPSRVTLVTLLASAAALTACGPKDEPEGNLAIGVAPFQFPGIRSACYSITVSEQTGDGLVPVWQNAFVCSGVTAYGDLSSPSYGNGEFGDITYIGTCNDPNNDVDENGNDLPTTNHVTIDLVYLFGEDGLPLTDWVEPPPFELDFPCFKNRDVAIDADFVVMRDAGQGFTDITVDFEDIHCAAKVDCNPSLLHYPDSEDRGNTIIVAVSCDIGEESGWTALAMTQIALVCDGQQVLVTPHNGPGEYAADAPSLFVYNVLGTEGTANDGTTSYWTTSIGVDVAAYQTCYISSLAMAAFDPANLTVTQTYPVITLGDPALGILFKAGGVFGCLNPLDGPGNLATEYWSWDELSFSSCFLSDEQTPPTFDSGPCELDGDALSTLATSP